MSTLVTLTLLALSPQNHSALVPGGDDLDTAKVQPRSGCDGRGGDIVVCGRSDADRFRMRPLAPRYVEAPIRAARTVAGGTLSVEAEQRSFPGAEAPAAMVRFRVPLGKDRGKK